MGQRVLVGFVTFSAWRQVEHFLLVSYRTFTVTLSTGQYVYLGEAYMLSTYLWSVE